MARQASGPGFDRDRPLAGRTVAVPEARELDVFARMLEDRGATAIRCPLIAILDAPDPAPIDAWLRRFAAGSCDDLVLLTGEGLRRLMGAASRAGLGEAMVARLKAVRKIARGPKPVRALREIGLDADMLADPPITDGVIAAMSRLDLNGRRIGVQLYPDKPHAELLGFIAAAGATADPVLPYVYASAADDRRVRELIGRLAAGAVDVIAFTGAPQVRRLFAVAETGGITTQLRAGLARTKIAAIGPVAAAELARLGTPPHITPRNRYSMKPLVNAIIEGLGA